MKNVWKLLIIVSTQVALSCSVMCNDVILGGPVYERPWIIEDVISEDLPVVAISTYRTKEIAYNVLSSAVMDLVELKQDSPDWNLIFPMLHFKSEDGFQLFNHILTCFYFHVRWSGEDGYPPNPLFLLWTVAFGFKQSMTECGVRPEDKELLETLDFLLETCAPVGVSGHEPVFSSLPVREVMSKLINPATISFCDHFIGVYKKELQESFAIESVEADPVLVMMKRIKELYASLEAGAESETFVFSNIAREMFDAIIAIGELKDRPYWRALKFLSEIIIEEQASSNPFFYN